MLDGIAAIPTAFHFEREGSPGYPVSEAEVIAEGFTVEPRDAQTLINYLEGCVNASRLISGTKPEAGIFLKPGQN